MLKEFKEFIIKGDVLDLAVGVVIGAAFTAIINSIVTSLITPLIAWIVSIFTNTTSLEGALSVLDFSPRDGVVFSFGSVISAILTFIITGLVLFLIVKAANKLRKNKKTDDEVMQDEAILTNEYLKEIRDLLKK